MDARTTPTAKKVDTKKLATLAMLSALAFAIMAVSKLLPSVEGFLDFDFKDVVICIAGFVYGPLSALAMIVVVCILEMLSPFSSSGIIGCIMNIVATASFCCPACYIYKHNHTMKGAVLGLVTGLVLLIITMLAWNYFLTPIYRGIPIAHTTGRKKFLDEFLADGRDPKYIGEPIALETYMYRSPDNFTYGRI